MEAPFQLYPHLLQSHFSISLIRRIRQRLGHHSTHDGTRHRQPRVSQGRRPEHPGRSPRRDGGQGTLPVRHAPHRAGESGMEGHVQGDPLGQRLYLFYLGDPLLCLNVESVLPDSQHPEQNLAEISTTKSK